MFKRICILSLLTTATSLAACPKAHGQPRAHGHPGAHGQPAGGLAVHQLDHGIYYGAAPRTDHDFAQLRRLGVRHVIDVRTFKVVASRFERRRADKFGISYQRIPTGFVPARTGNVPRIMAQLTKANCGPVYFHCNLGSDRTGMLVAIYRTEHLGWNSRTAFETWKAQQFNTNLKELDRYYWQHVGTNDSSAR